MYPAGVPGISARHVAVGSLLLRVLESGPRDGVPVLLVHGWGACVYTFDAMIPALSRAGYRVIAFDLPGLGLSEKPTREDVYTTAALCEVVMQVADACDVKDFALLGHSLGGSIALELVTRGERRIRKAILISSVGLGTAPIVIPVRLLSPRFVNRFVPALLTRRLIALLLRFVYVARDRPTPRDIDEYWAPSQFDEVVFACRALVHRAAWRRVAATRLRGIRIPVLVIAGAKDRLVRGSDARARLIPSARVVVVREAGHLVLQEQSARTSSEVLRFLAE